MAAAKAKNRKGGRRDTPTLIANFLNINGSSYVLGDLHKSDFSEIDDPKASVKSLQEWAISINNILRGFAQEENNES